MQGKHDVVLVNEDVEETVKRLEIVAMGWEGWESVGEELPEFRLEELDA